MIVPVENKIRYFHNTSVKRRNNFILLQTDERNKILKDINNNCFQMKFFILLKSYIKDTLTFLPFYVLQTSISF